MRISFLVPTYNDINVSELVSELRSSANKLLEENKITDFEIVISDDCSKPSYHLSLIDVSDERTKLVVQNRNLGVVENFRALYNLSKFELIAVVPGDGEWPPIEVCRIISQHVNRLTNSILLTVRSKRFPNYSFLRVVISIIYNIFASVAVKQLIPDLGSVKVFPRVLIVEPKTKSLLSELELLINARNQNFEIINAIINNAPRNAGKSSIRPLDLAWKCVVDLFRLVNFPISSKHRKTL